MPAFVASSAMRGALWRVTRTSAVNGTGDLWGPAHLGRERHLRLVDVRLVALRGPEGLDDRHRLSRVLTLDDEWPAAVVPLPERGARALVLHARDREVDVRRRRLRRADRPADGNAVREQLVE